MATRATISVEGLQSPIQLYKHWDGYPDGTLPWLEKFNKKFAQLRGDDPEYKFAQLIRSSVTMAEEFRLDTSSYTGWGVVSKDDNWGAEYHYTLHIDGTVTYKPVSDR
jgi:hypothetical protein